MLRPTCGYFGGTVVDCLSNASTSRKYATLSDIILGYTDHRKPQFVLRITTMDTEYTRAFYWCYGAIGRDFQRRISIYIYFEVYICIYLNCLVPAYNYDIILHYRISEIHKQNKCHAAAFVPITRVTLNSCPFACLFVAIITTAVNKTLSRRFFWFISLTI